MQTISGPDYGRVLRIQFHALGARQASKPAQQPPGKLNQRKVEPVLTGSQPRVGTRSNQQHLAAVMQCPRASSFSRFPPFFRCPLYLAVRSLLPSGKRDVGTDAGCRAAVLR